MSAELEETRPNRESRLSWLSSNIVLNFIVIYHVVIGLLWTITFFWMVSQAAELWRWYSVGLVFFVFGCGIWFRVELVRKAAVVLYGFGLIAFSIAILAGLYGVISNDYLEFRPGSTFRSFTWLLILFIVVKCLSAKNIVSQFPSNKHYIPAFATDGTLLPKNTKKASFYVSIIISFFVGLQLGGISAFNIYSKTEESAAIGDQAETVEEKASDKSVSKVVVASKDIYPGEIIDKTNAAARNIPNEFVTSYAVLARDYEASIAGKNLNRSLKNGEPILRHFVD